MRKEDEVTLFKSILPRIHLKSISKENIILTKQIIETINITKGDNCSKCFKDFNSKDSHYYCYWCNIYFCKTCAENYSHSKQGLNILTHFHNLILIPNGVKKETSSMRNIPLYRLGNNLIFKNNIFKELDQNHGKIRCCICRAREFIGIRYLCLSCEDRSLEPDGSSIGQNYCQGYFSSE